MARYDHDGDEPYMVIEKHQSAAGVGLFLAGLVIGAGAALLLAPQSGLETRQALGRKARRARDAAGRKANDMRDSVTDTFEEARQRVEDRIESARQAIDLRKHQVSRAVDAGRAAAHDARVELEQRLADARAREANGATRTGEG
jgi:gas vesicle protein